jgi:hypothetical protein
MHDLNGFIASASKYEMLCLLRVQSGLQLRNINKRLRTAIAAVVMMMMMMTSTTAA